MWFHEVKSKVNVLIILIVEVAAVAVTGKWKNRSNYGKSNLSKNQSNLMT
jgi:hypothetical protein